MAICYNAAADQPKCNVPGCPNKPKASRGLCNTCYRKSRDAIEAGVITKQQLIEAGIYKPHGNAGTNRRFEQWLAEYKKNQ